ncbi:MAG TPA: orotidine-5'-phosphate decarboxylase [Solirubrobacteraceae bacterium]|nr:orotidine-5'-phosphate decarboxylase [Solirubrobacteraceae bacterium]
MPDEASPVTAAADPGAGAGAGPRISPGFGDRLAGRVAERRSQIVLGLDPDPARLWPRALEIVAEAAGTPAERASRAITAHCRLVLEAAGEHCVAVKPQVACFERLGAPGWASLAEVVRDAAGQGLIVIGDAKRGDVDISARAYGQAFFGRTPSPFGDIEGLGVDALTVNPLLGRDSLSPLVESARAAGGAVLALVRTSNPGAADVQDRALAEGGTVSGALARIVDELGRPAIGAAGLSDVGAVTGATAPERLEQLRALMPHAVLLLPGIGPQGGSGRGLAPAFAPGPAGGLVSASRAIVYAHERDSTVSAGAGAGSSEPAAAARAEASRLQELIWSLYA